MERWREEDIDELIPKRPAGRSLPATSLALVLWSDQTRLSMPHFSGFGILSITSFAPFT